jgi:hypothetical protein
MQKFLKIHRILSRSIKKKSIPDEFSDFENSDDEDEGADEDDSR